MAYLDISLAAPSRDVIHDVLQRLDSSNCLVLQVRSTLICDAMCCINQLAMAAALYQTQLVCWLHQQAALNALGGGGCDKQLSARFISCVTET